MQRRGKKQEILDVVMSGVERTRLISKIVYEYVHIIVSDKVYIYMQK